MKFMSFTPEVTRLRRLARACQAGEVSRRQYRESRRALIDDLMQTQGVTFEDTVPRFDRDITLRRETANHAELDDSSTSWASWWWLALVLMLMLGLAVPVIASAQIQTQSITAGQQVKPVVIEPVARRDPNPLQSKRLQVAKVTWTVPAALQAHITQAEVDALLEQALAASKQANAPRAHGFNQTELEEVARLLSALGVHEPDTRLNVADLQDLQAVIARQKERRGVSVVQLEQVAAALQTRVQAAGFGLARAYLPAQTVAHQTVALEVQVGALAEVVVTPVAGGAAEDLGLNSRFSHLLGKAVRRSEVESELNRINRIPGLVAQGKFVPGTEVGETVLELSVAEFSRFSGAVQLDNYGYEETSETRMSLSGRWNNPLGQGDTLTATALVGLESEGQQYAKLRYMRPLFAGRYEGVASVGFGDAEVDGTNNESSEGDLTVVEVGLTDTHTLTRQSASELYFGAGLHDLDWDFPQPFAASDSQRAAFAVVQWRGHKLWDDTRTSITGGAGLHAGDLDESRYDQDEGFYRLRADVALWKVLGTPLAGLGYHRTAKGMFSLRGQLTNTALPSTLRLATSGPTANRGFAPGLGYDDGLSAHLQLQFDYDRGAWWLFLDSGYGEQHRETDRWLHQTSAGLGFETRLGVWQQGALSTRFSVGVPLTQTSNIDDSELGEDDVQVFWSLKFVP